MGVGVNVGVGDGVLVGVKVGRGVGVAVRVRVGAGVEVGEVGWVGVFKAMGAGNDDVQAVSSWPTNRTANRDEISVR